ncbi:MAG: hypothetical protein HKP14_02285, partial [Bacteroidia bacterium]|nr:hypothetical protein [Bacteroidia bacterium]
MKKVALISWLIIAFLIIGIVITGSSKKEDQGGNHAIDLSEFIQELESESENIFSDIIPISFGSEQAKKAHDLRKKKWYVISFENKKEVYWNSNKLSFDSTILNHSIFPTFYYFGDDLYSVFKYTSDDFLSFRIANDGKLHQRLIDFYPELKHARLNHEKQEGNIQPIEPLGYSYEKSSYSRTLYLGLLASFLLLFLGLYYLRNNNPIQYIVLALMVVLNIVVYKYSPYSFEEFYLLKSNAFTLLQNNIVLLLLYVHLTGLIFITATLYHLIRELRDEISIPLLSIGLFFIADFVIDLGQNLAQRSNISFDFEKLFGLTSISFVSLAFICLVICLLWILSFYSEIAPKLSNIKNWILLALGAIAFVVFQHFDSYRSILNLLPPVIVVIISFLLFRGIKSYKRQIHFHFLFSALLAALIIHLSQSNRENNYVAEYASTLMESKDSRAELILKSIENQLAQEFLVPEDYQNFVFKKDIIESRIKQLYFSNYLEKYELKLLSFDPTGENINQNDIYSYNDLNEVYNNNTERTQSDYFYQIDKPTNFNGYIAKYENCDIEGHFGTTFIILQPRVVQSEFLYPEVFANQRSKKVINLDDFSYGIYFNNRLISQKGSFSYQLNNIPIEAPKSLFYFGETRHRVFYENKYTVAISENENTLRSWLSSFTFTLIILFPIGFILSMLTRLLVGPNLPLATAFIPGASKYISSRIQTSLTIILLAALLLSVYIIISYIRSNYNQTLENQLLVKVKNISTQFQNKVDLSKKLSNDEQRRLILNEQSSSYKVDINLYNQEGRLLNSTKPYLTENEILGAHMNPTAFAELTLNESSQLLLQEELEGSDYLSAYVPLFDGKNQVIGYLNTPYFAKNEELNKQISSLVVNILNIYFLLLLSGVLIAYFISRQISKPLLLIREKIAKTVLLGGNELIVYERDDEIGQLVKQYNKMVLELDESANQMAETEREGAWREMAKQVAHEIKNPLTPMKLSIQHLQRAYENGPSEKLNDLFSKTSKLLIDQINSLSNMASEFSHFAKMPEDKFEDFNVSEVLKSTVNLFIRSENTTIKSNIESNVWINADPEQIQRVFNNLIKNAIQAIPDGQKGKVEITLEQTNGFLKISVKDNGKGIPVENYKKVFVPNFSTKTSGMG